MSDTLSLLGNSMLDRMLRLDSMLKESGVPYAFGGAVALCYYMEPRATNDFDINVSCPDTEAPQFLVRFAELGISVTERDMNVVRRDGQVRLWWDEYPVDLFFESVDFHVAIKKRTHNVPFRS